MLETSMGETRQSGLFCGLGRCGRCSCSSFRGSGNICEDCGHHYDEHGTSPFRGPEQDHSSSANEVSCVKA